jgi:hypothetical protein
MGARRDDLMTAIRWFVVVGVMVGLVGPVWATTYQVGPSRPYATLQDVAGLLQPGDLVEVDGDATYPGDVVFSVPGTQAQPITIRGIEVNGQPPVISGGTNTVVFQTPFPYSPPGADHYVFEGFEVTGGTSRCLYHQAGDLVVRDTVVRDCPAHGILGADAGSGSLTLERVEVYGCGDGTFRHQIYVATDEVNRPGSVFRMQSCFVHDANGGNNVKSRAERNEIYFNWIEGAYYHELELIGPDPGGAPSGWSAGMAREDSDVVGNVLWKKGSNADFFVIRVGGDGTGESDGRYRFVNNTILAGDGAVFRVFDGIESLEMHNNVVHRIGAGDPDLMRTAEADWAAGSAQISGASNWVETGSVNQPAQWTGTLSGADPGLVDLGADDPRPAEGSPLIDQGTAAPSSPPGYAFPGGLFPPSGHPPLGGDVTTAGPRPAVGSLPDIGAFEFTGLFADGFESGGTGAWSSTLP